jgi:hypothetical protein
VRASENINSRNCPKRGLSNAPSVNLAGKRRNKWAISVPFRQPARLRAGSSEAFRTVSLGSWVNRARRRAGSLIRPNDRSPAAYLGGGFPRRISNLRVLPQGIMLPLTTRGMRRNGSPFNNLPSAALWEGVQAAQRPYLQGFRNFLDEPWKLACSQPSPHHQEDSEHHNHRKHHQQDD